MYVEKEEDFSNILNLVRMKPEIKELIEGVLDNMNKDSDLVSGYYNWRDEQDKMNRSIINEVKEKTLKIGIEQGIEQKEREVVLNMYSNNIPMEMICKCTNLTCEQVNEIINNLNLKN